MLKKIQCGVECINRRRNCSDPVGIRFVARIPCFGHSLMLLAAIPCQPNAYGALASFPKNRFGVEMLSFGVEMCRFGVEMCRYGVEMCRFGFEMCRFGVG